MDLRVQITSQIWYPWEKHQSLPKIYKKNAKLHNHPSALSGYSLHIYSFHGHNLL